MVVHNTKLMNVLNVYVIRRRMKRYIGISQSIPVKQNEEDTK
jgi:hypothetical protein